MRQALLKTVNLPAALAGSNPVVIGKGTDVPARIAVRNVGAVMIFISQASQDIVGPGGVGSSAFRLLPGAAEVFVVDAAQELYGAGQGANGMISVAVSEALPLV
jgi:hypothetical protein